MLLIIPRSVVFEYQSREVSKNKSKDVIDVVDNHVDGMNAEDTDVNEDFRLPMRSRDELTPEWYNGPTHSVSTRGSSAPSRIEEEDEMIRPER
ncbi:uncharacterized protein PHALS_04256 [Plasmopara halstedii]|uniref:Uncharacterized protein n=1 Tax=Plasmopara halstedii TaxID=4781 RepID=A0A0P1B0F6_PLAHL|nr:uncharacterized protein PHALS_04256 [Plasmopara halstedii]CEG47376.1 hypothetical protein PHALS_04256 [Plasmopara halstedii]|eukprot:XP_024583745.1 hypothetical protein PHALS_04256 [Plasmopara halstedii]